MKRDWTAAREKVLDEGKCRACDKPLSSGRIEAAHIMGREFDKKPTLDAHTDWLAGVVAPIRIVPLCGPATDTGTCHNRHDSHDPDFDLLRHLSLPEQLQAHADAGSMQRAYNRLVGRNLRS